MKLAKPQTWTRIRFTFEDGRSCEIVPVWYPIKASLFFCSLWVN